MIKYKKFSWVLIIMFLSGVIGLTYLILFSKIEGIFSSLSIITDNKILILIYDFLPLAIGLIIISLIGVSIFFQLKKSYYQYKLSLVDEEKLK